MSETPPAPSVKSILKSKTFWLNFIAFLATFYPPINTALAEVPGGAAGMFAAVNIALRLISHGKVSIFPPDEVEKSSGPAGGLSPCLIVTGLACTAAGLMGFVLSSCSADQLAAARSVPIHSTFHGSFGSVGYDSKSGLSIDATVPDGKSGK